MAAPAKMRLRNEKHSSNITKRGNVPSGSRVKTTGYTVGPVLLGFFLFVVLGSAVLQIIRSSQVGGL